MERAKTIGDPALILMLSDIDTPGMSGLGMLPKVTADRPNVPVIMPAVTELLTKPIDSGLLRQEIDERLQRAA